MPSNFYLITPLKNLAFKTSKLFSGSEKNTIFMTSYLCHPLKDQCVGFRGIYWPKWNIIFVIMFSFVYNHLKLRCMVFSLASNEQFISTQGAGPLLRSPPCCWCFYSSPEQTNQTLFLRWSGSHHWFSYTLGKGGVRRGVFSWLQSATSPLRKYCRCH